MRATIVWSKHMVFMHCGPSTGVFNNLFFRDFLFSGLLIHRNYLYYFTSWEACALERGALVRYLCYCTYRFLKDRIESRIGKKDLDPRRFDYVMGLLADLR